MTDVRIGPIAAGIRRKKQCVRFARASSQYVDMGAVSAFNFQRTDAFSLTCWFKSTDTSGGKAILISKTDPAVSFRGYDLALETAGQLVFRMDNTLVTDGREVFWNGVWDDNVWHMMVLTSGTSGLASAFKAYVDGTQLTVSSSVDASTGTTQTTAHFILGGDATGRYFNGKIDNAAVYNKELTPTEVATIYDGGAVADLTVVGPTLNLVGYWTMGENASFPTLPDSSGGAHPGTMTNQLRIDITNR